MDDIVECSLTELVDDPLIGLLMKSDGVSPGSIEVLFERVAQERARAAHGMRSRLRDEEAAPCTSS
jgi:hypothetical protein